MTASAPRTFDDARLVTLYWQLRHRQDGRVLRCGLYETHARRALLAGYDDGWLRVAPLANEEAGAALSERWRLAVLATGGFVELTSCRADGISVD